MVGIKKKRFLQELIALSLPAEFAVYCRKIAECVGIIGLELQRSLKVTPSFFKVASFSKCVAEAIVRPGFAGRLQHHIAPER